MKTYSDLLDIDTRLHLHIELEPVGTPDVAVSVDDIVNDYPGLSDNIILDYHIDLLDLFSIDIELRNKHYTIDINFTVRSIGTTTVASIVSGIVFTYSKDASNAFEGADFSIVNNTTFNTTIDNTLNVTVQWGTTDTENSIYSEYFVLNKVY
jgi:hypothetical protein